MVNDNRVKRGFFEKVVCPRCGNVRKSTYHALRYCPGVSQLWKMLVHPNHWDNFFKSNMIGWVSMNFKRILGKDKDPCWKKIFGIVIWVIWLNCNEIVFEDNKKEIPTLFWPILGMLMECDSSLGLLKYSNS